MSKKPQLNHVQVVKLYQHILKVQDDWTAARLTWTEAAKAATDALGFQVAVSAVTQMCKEADDITFTSSAKQAARSENAPQLEHRVNQLDNTLGSLLRAVESINHTIKMHQENIDRLHKQAETQAMTIGSLTMKTDALMKAARTGRVTAISEAYRDAENKA